MKPWRSLVLALLAGMLLAVPGLAQQKHTISFDDLIAFGRVGDPQVSPDGKVVAFSVTRYDLAKNAGNSDVWIVPIAGGAARQLTQSEKRDNNARWSPDGKKLAFISSRDGSPQVWILDVASGEARKLTSISTGADGVIWSQDGNNLAFTSDVYPDCRDDACNAQREKAAESSKVKAKIFDHLLYRHWDAWKDGKRTHIFVVPAAGGTARDLTPGDYDAPPFSLGGPTDYDFSPDGKELCFARNTDKVEATSTNGDLWTVPLTGSEPKKITANPAYDGSPLYSPDGKYIAYRAQRRPGFEADRFELMLFDRVARTSRSITASLDRSVSEMVWAPDSRTIYFAAEDQGFSGIWRVGVGGEAPLKVIEKSYNGELKVAPDGRTLVFTRQSLSRPAEVYRANADGRDARPLTAVNDAALGRIDFGAVESITYPGADAVEPKGSGGDGSTFFTPIQAWIVKPPAFDPKRKYPAVFLIHGGPQGAWEDNFSYRWNIQMFAARGYVVFASNPHGSTGFGQKFTDEISGDWGGKVYLDLMRGADYLTKLPYIDAARVAAAGASYGGYMINWIEGHSERFRCLVSHDGVYNAASMFGSTEELWFPLWDFQGTPWNNPALYEKWSPSSYVKNFKTPMLVIHGELDYRVPVTQGFELFTALQLMKVPSKFLYFPDEGHWVLKPQNSRLWWKTVQDWIDQWTKAK
ncbi:MAG: S9 family peptidase [Acidobacteriia bacterium]|nr:S9 family peptidase [Terriglobia bacterium]